MSEPDKVREKTDEGQPGTSRLETFSDGVIAIILTIMVLNLKVDAAALDRGFWRGIVVPLGPRFVGYTLSFIMVSLYWLNHHQLLPTAPKSTPSLIWWNSNFLFWMSLVPAVTGLWGEAPLSRTAVGLYGAVLFATSVSFALLRWKVAQQRQEHRAVRWHHRKHMRRGVLGAALYGAAVLLAPVSVYISIVLILVVPVLFFLPERLPRGAVVDD